MVEEAILKTLSHPAWQGVGAIITLVGLVVLLLNSKRRSAVIWIAVVLVGAFIFMLARGAQREVAGEPNQRNSPPTEAISISNSQCPSLNGTIGEQLLHGMCKYNFPTLVSVVIPDGWWADSYPEYGIPAGTRIQTNEMTLKPLSLLEEPFDSQCPIVNGVGGKQLASGGCKYFSQKPINIIIPNGWSADAWLTNTGQPESSIPAGTSIETVEMTLKPTSQ